MSVIESTTVNGTIAGSTKLEELSETEFPYVIPASCNWFCPNIVSCLNGYCAVGGKNIVFIFNLLKNPPICEWDMCVASSLGIKVSSVALVSKERSKDESSLPEYLVAGLEDGFLRIIDIKTKGIYKEHRKHQFKISAMSWCPIVAGTILSGDSKGNISVWNYEDNSIDLWNPISMDIICLQVSPIKMGIFIVGYQSGHILVGDMKKLQVLQILKSHIEEVSSLSWCPVSRDGKFEFVSGCKDRTIRLWEISSERPTATFYVPRKFYKRKDISFYQPVLWMNDNQIISGLPQGNLLCWDMKGNATIIEDAHDRAVFTLCKDTLTNQFITVSMDRQLIVWDEHHLRPAHRIPSFGGFVYTLATSLHDPYSVAVGVGDNIIRVLSSAHSHDRYHFANFWQNIKTKVTVVAFHPKLEGFLGFGTEDGHVGCLNTHSRKSEVSVSYHRKTVYSLTWGPPHSCDVEATDFKINCLYTIGGEGGILMHKMGAFNKEAVDLGKVIREVNNFKLVPLRSDIAWKVGYTYFALGNEDGSIELYKTSTMKCVSKVSFHKKAINCMAWHHNYSSDGTGKSFSDWLASGSNGDDIFIADFSVIKNDGELDILQEPYRKLQGHTSRITRVVWNPHKNGILASSSYDGTVQVWDVERNIPLVNFRDHIGRVYSVMWSYLDSEVVYSGGDDFTLRRWKISKQAYNAPPAAKKNKKKKKKRVNGELEHRVDEMEVITNGDCPELHETSVGENKNPEEINIQPDLQKSYDFSTSAADIAVKLVPREDQKGSQTRKKKMKSTLKINSRALTKTKEAMQDDCIKLAKFWKAKADGKDMCGSVDMTNEEDKHLAMYTTRGDVHKMVAAECSGHEETSAHEQLLYLEMWRNNIGGLLDKADEGGWLNDTLVALAPLGGYEMWKAAVYAYAERLENRHSFHMASVYYTAAGDVYRAIKVLKENRLFKEALLIAKIQLASDDPLINELYVARGKKLATEGNYEIAAECFLAAGSVGDAVAALAIRGDGSSLYAALKVADIYNLEESSALLPRSISMLMQEQKWKMTHECLKKCSQIEVLHFQAVVGEFLVDSMYTSDLMMALPTVESNHKEQMVFADEESSSKSNEGCFTSPSFISEVLHRLKNFCTFSRDNSAAFDHLDFKQLESKSRRTATGLSHLDVSQVVAELSNMILLGIVALVKGDCLDCFRKWLHAFELLRSQGYQTSLQCLFDTLFPQHYQSFNEILQFCRSKDVSNAQPDLKKLLKNFVAFNGLGILYSAWYKVDSEDMCEANKTENNVLSSEFTNGFISVDIRTDPSKMTEDGKDGDFCNDINIDTELKFEYLERACKMLREYSHFNRGTVKLISCISSILLSDEHLLYNAVLSEHAKIEKDSLELDIKKRLREHFQSKKKIEKLSSNEQDEDTIPRVLENIVNVVTRLDASDCINVINCFENPKNGEEFESDMMYGYLSRKKATLLENLKSFPPYIKDFAFPRPDESYFVLLYLYVMDKTNDPKNNELVDCISSWGRDHGIYPKFTNYLEKLLTNR